ncbi:MAG TPA: hypothetical protein VHO01_05570 [Jatrophihabitans sp.]|nr:hypothetical protein [Jatrophihabitans sp.]
MTGTGTALSDTSGDPAMFKRSLGRRVLAEVQWSFRWPCNWLLGVFLNLVLSFLWLIVVPLTGRRHQDAVILVGTYFAVFILADVTTTNVLGLDAVRVRAGLARGVSVTRMLLTKNLALLIIVGIPTLLATAVLTVRSEHPYRLVLTLPGVALPMFAWLGVGNVVSTVYPVAIESLRTRWQQRSQWRRLAPWLAHLAIPYALLYLVDPVGDLPASVFRLLPHAWRSAELRGVGYAGYGLLIWALGTWFATTWVRRRGLQLR